MYAGFLVTVFQGQTIERTRKQVVIGTTLDIVLFLLEISTAAAAAAAAAVAVAACGAWPAR